MRKKLKEKIIKILQSQEFGKLDTETADQILELFKQEKRKWVGEIEKLMKKYGYPDNDNVAVDILREAKQTLKPKK